MDNQLLILGCVFGAVALVAMFVVNMMFARGEDGKLRNRLTGDGKSSAEQGKTNVSTGVKAMLEKVGEAAAEPFMPKTREKQSSLRKQLGYAGIYNPGALKLVTGSKMIFMIVGLGVGYLLGLKLDNMLLGLPIGGLVGYLAPGIWLKQKVKSNQRALQYGLPDALDLMVVCVEAGLTVDAAMQRVGQEVAIAHPNLSRELGIAHMETRVGLSRMDALKNLGLRTGSQALQSLGAMLIQADRFGTSIASALRIHADSLRMARQHAAEEMAAKSAVKMSFPLVLFIFPATFIVLAGPTVIQLMNSELMK